MTNTRDDDTPQGHLAAWGLLKDGSRSQLNYGHINAFYYKTFLNHATDIEQLNTLY
jgi:hypothetical protein